MHVLDMNKVLLVPRGFADRQIPFLNHLQNPVLNWCRYCQGSLRKLAYQLIQELFGCDLKMKWISAVLDAIVQQL